MKKILIIIVVFLSIFQLHGQTKRVQGLMAEIEGQWKLDDNKNLVYQEILELPGIDKNTLFQRAENYFIYNYNSGKDVIQTKDKEQGLIIGAGYYLNLYVGGLFLVGNVIYNAQHFLRIDIKEEKVRIILTVMQYKVDIQSQQGPSLNSSSDEPIRLTYPITDKSITKTNDGNAFYNLHLRCKNSINKLTTELKNGLSKSKTDGNW